MKTIFYIIAIAQGKPSYSLGLLKPL